jgi:hypothetical protein
MANTQSKCAHLPRVAFHLQARNIAPSFAKMQGQRRQKSHAIAITLSAQNEVLTGID